MRRYLGGLTLPMAGFASEATAQYQTVVTPPPGGVPVVAGGWYTAGTVFANGMAYPPGTPVQEAGAVTQATYAAPAALDAFYYAPTVAGYPSFGATYSGGMYSRSSYYSPGYTSFGLGLGFGTGGYGYNRGYAGYGLGTYPGYGGYSSFGTGYGGGYSGSRGYGGSRSHGGGSGGRRR